MRVFRPRLTLGALILMTLLAIPSLALAGAINTTGPIDGNFIQQPPNSEAMCNLAAPTTPEDYRCDATSDGVVDLTTIGAGTYTAAMRFDWSIATPADNCAVVTGTMVMTTPAGTITFTITDLSRACIEFIFTELDLEMDVASGTGSFAGMTGFLHGEGGIGPFGKGGAVMHLDTSGNIVAGAPTPTPTPTPTAAAAAATPVVSLLPNAAFAQPDEFGGLGAGTILVLAALLLMSSGGYLAWRAGLRP